MRACSFNRHTRVLGFLYMKMIMHEKDFSDCGIENVIFFMSNHSWSTKMYKTVVCVNRYLVSQQTEVFFLLLIYYLPVKASQNSLCLIKECLRVEKYYFAFYKLQYLFHKPALKIENFDERNQFLVYKTIMIMQNGNSPGPSLERVQGVH